MTSLDIAVAAAGAAAILWVNWYFFLSSRGSAAGATLSGGVQEVRIVVEGGYQPAEIRVSRGKPVRLRFDRRETNPCSEEVVLPDFGVRRFLPPFQTTAVEFTPDRAGRFEFTCGMGMLRGRLTVEELRA
jgi:plastocyanin domain-containing protein